MTKPKKNETFSKPILLYVLEVLRNRDEPEMPMTAIEVQECLQEQYGITLDKRTVRRNLKLLKDDKLACVYCKSGTLTDKNGTTTDRDSSWYCRPETQFDRSELVFLAEGVASSQKVPAKYKQDLIEKLKKLGDGKGLTALQKAKSGKVDTKTNRDFFYSIALIDEAMSKGECLELRLGEHNLNGKLTCSPEDKFYIVDPEYIFVYNGRYYLKTTLHDTDKRPVYRIDMIHDIEIALDGEGNPIIANKKPYEGNEDEAFEDAHLFVDDELGAIKLRVVDTPKIRFQLFDRFGEDIKLSLYGKDRNYLIATVRANKVALKAWIMSHADDVEVIKPTKLRKEIHDDAVKLADTYK